jgi:hypothetical protein
MLHVAAIVSAISWFGLIGVLWYAKPSNVVWLVGSGMLGAIFFSGFFAYLALADRKTKS